MTCPSSDLTRGCAEKACETCGLLSFDGAYLRQEDEDQCSCDGSEAGDLAQDVALLNHRQAMGRCTGWKREPLAYPMEHANYGREATGKQNYFNDLRPPYFFGAVRSFGEYRAKRDEIRPPGRIGSQELFAKKPANTGDFRGSNFGERDLPWG
jgi:hypothetical protein